MAYGLRYQSIFSNEQEQTVTVSLSQKDYVGDPDTFITSKLELTDSSDENTVIAREAKLSIWADDATPITWETFLAGSYDEWQVLVTVDTLKFFEGYLTPEEGSSPFLPKPYEVTLRATNGLKLLKDVAFTGLAGETIKGKYTLSDVLCAALLKTGLELNVRIYGSLYNIDMVDRAADIDATYWNQVKIDHRTLQKDPTTFISCYETIVKLLFRHSRLFYFNGMWVVFFTPEHQYAPDGLFYTDFASDGTLIGGAEDTEGYASVGKAEAIYPIKEDGLASSSFAIKYAKTNYQYKVWPEIPLNNKFSRGTQIGSGTDGDGNPYVDYSIDDWTSGTWQGNPTEFANLPATTVANPDPWYRRSTFNIYGVELKREVIIERGTAAGGRYVQSEGIPINIGDKVRFNFDWRASVDLGTGDPVPVQLTPYIIEDGTGTKYTLRSKSGLTTEVKWETAGVDMIGIYTTPNGDLTLPQSIGVESPVSPVQGTLYILMWTSVALGDNTYSAYKGLSMEYIPFVGGGYIPVSGDYWQHTQTANQLDKDEADIEISDTIIRVLQGCLFNADGVTATLPQWYYYQEPGGPMPIYYHFKEYVDRARFNLGYRRFYRIEGSFTGLLYSPVNVPTALQPVSYHKNYLFSDLSTPRQFILTTLSMDLGTGDIKATFEEVYASEDDGTQDADAQEFNYIFGQAR